MTILSFNFFLSSVVLAGDVTIQQVKDELLHRPGVAGVSVGEKDGTPTIKVYIYPVKFGNSVPQLPKLPSNIEGYQVETEEVEPFQAGPALGVPEVPFCQNNISPVKTSTSVAKTDEAFREFLKRQKEEIANVKTQSVFQKITFSQTRSLQAPTRRPHIISTQLIIQSDGKTSPSDEVLSYGPDDKPNSRQAERPGYQLSLKQLHHLTYLLLEARLSEINPEKISNSQICGGCQATLLISTKTQEFKFSFTLGDYGDYQQRLEPLVDYLRSIIDEVKISEEENDGSSNNPKNSEKSPHRLPRNHHLADGQEEHQLATGEKIVGMTKEKAIQILHDAGIRCRIVSEDGQSQAGDCRYDPTRVGLVIEKGVVTSTTRG